MFFIWGLSSGQKELSYMHNNICNDCGRFSRYNILMTYTYFSLFFIPLIKWNKKYYVVSPCCHSTYRINSDIGKRIKNGEDVIITPDDYIEIVKQNRLNICHECKTNISENYEYCPKCGAKLN